MADGRDLQTIVPWFVREELNFYNLPTSAFERPSTLGRRVDILASCFKASLGICSFQVLMLYAIPFYRDEIVPFAQAVFVSLSIDGLALTQPGVATVDLALPSWVTAISLGLLALSTLILLHLRFAFEAVEIRIQLKILEGVKAFYFFPALQDNFHTMFERPNASVTIQAQAVRSCRRNIAVLAEDIARASRKLSGGISSQAILGSDHLAVVMMWAADRPWDYRRRRLMLTASIAYLTALGEKDVLDSIDLGLPEDIEIPKPRPIRSTVRRLQLFLRDRALWLGFIAALAVLAIELTFNFFVPQ